MPKKKAAFRLKGKGEDSFREVMEKFKKKGWIRESNSAWGARAFVVPKPGGPGEYPMVVDYRHLNMMTEDDCHPIPNIEDMISAKVKMPCGPFLTLREAFTKCTFPPKRPPLQVL